MLKLGLLTNFNHSKCQVPFVNKIQPINYQEQQQQETLAEVGAKSSSEVWFGPGLKNSLSVMMGDKYNVGLTAKNRYFKMCLLESHVHICEQFLHDSWCFFVLFTYNVQKSQALSQYTLNKVYKAAGSRCRISTTDLFIISLLHYSNRTYKRLSFIFPTLVDIYQNSTCN